MPVAQSTAKTYLHHLSTFLWIALGAFLAAVAIRIFLVPESID